MKLIEYIFPKYTTWIDVGMFDRSGNYKLIQMKIRLRDNKKKFRIKNLGFINDYQQKDKIYNNILNKNICELPASK